MCTSPFFHVGRSGLIAAVPADVGGVDRRQLLGQPDPPQEVDVGAENQETLQHRWPHHSRS